MTPRDRGHRCACACHEHVAIHVTLNCDCGRPVTPPEPRPTRPPGHGGKGCPPPPIEAQPGTIDIPQDQPPPPPRTSPDPPWHSGRPPIGDPGEIPWFRGKIGDIDRNGPTFGPRKDEYLPFLVVRAASGDRGARPYTGAFWESPDIFVLPNTDAAAAPLLPPALGGTAVANVPNTLYAHIWNLGKAPAYRVRVEFYWCNPSLGLSRASGHLVGAATIDLADRFTVATQWTARTSPSGRYLSRGCHAVVRCPETWVPVFENNGHECLVVRAFEPMMDPVPLNQFSASADRHVGQRNIAVAQSGSPASLDLGLHLGYPDASGEAEVDLQLDPPGSMEWLRLYAGRGGAAFDVPAAPIVAGFLPPTAQGARWPAIDALPPDCRPGLLTGRQKFHRGCDPLSVGFHASVGHLEENEAQVLRLRQRVGGELVGGYTVVLVGRR